MSKTVFFNAIKKTVRSHLPGSKILLFGSRARGSFNAQSDVDLLIVTTEDFDSREKMNMESKISKSLVFLLHVPFDVLLYSEKEMEQKKNVKGLVIYHALKDAVEL